MFRACTMKRVASVAIQLRTFYCSDNNFTRQLPHCHALMCSSQYKRDICG
jgi:hypothetical protein